MLNEEERVKHFYLTLLAMFGLVSSVEASFPVSCAPELRSVWETIQKLPEARQLIQSVVAEGPLHVEVNRHLTTKFGAFWTGDARAILVNPPRPGNDRGETIGSILFELHNALADRELTRLDEQAESGQISKQRYIEAVERIEYRNSINASRIARTGIVQGLFPATAHLPTYPTFEEHYRVQQEAGHSAWIGRTYDQLR